MTQGAGDILGHADPGAPRRVQVCRSSRRGRYERFLAASCAPEAAA